MHKLAKDPELNEIAIRLKTLVWQVPLGSVEVDSLTEVADQRGGKRRLVTPLPNWKDWSVRMYLGGEQRTIGIAGPNQLPQALRYADMAMMYFWKYRVRGAAPPTEQQLNRLVEDVQQDMIHETDAVQMLKDIEAHLLHIGALKTGAQRQESRQRKKLPNLRTQSAVNHAELLEKFEGLCSQFDALANQVTGIKESQQAQLEALQVIARMLARAPQQPQEYRAIETGDPLPVNPITIS